MGKHDIRDITGKVALDPETGEVTDETIGEYLGMSAEEKAHAEEKKRRVILRKERGTIGRFVLLNPGVYAQVVAQLSKVEGQVLAQLIDDIRQKEGTEVYSPSGRIAERIGSPVAVISRAIRRLETLGVLQRRLRGYYVLNPWVAYSGPADDWRWATDEWPLPEGTSL